MRNFQCHKCSQFVKPLTESVLKCTGQNESKKILCSRHKSTYILTQKLWQACSKYSQFQTRRCSSTENEKWIQNLFPNQKAICNLERKNQLSSMEYHLVYHSLTRAGPMPRWICKKYKWNSKIFFCCWYLYAFHYWHLSVL